MNGERGQALPLAVMVLAFGTLVIGPFLGHAGSSLVGSNVYGQKIEELYGCDSGVEHAIWSLTNNGLAAQIPDLGDALTYQLSEDINGVTPNITVTANATASGGVVGDIGTAAITTLTFDNSACYEPDFIPVSGNIYAVAYRGASSRGTLKTVSIAANGTISPTIISTLIFDTTGGSTPDIIPISGGVYAVAYTGSGNKGYLKTVSISTNGTISSSIVSTLTFDNTAGYEPNIIPISGSVYAVAYRGTSSKGTLITVSITANGTISPTIISTLTFDSSAGATPNIIPISGNVYALAYKGNGNKGFLKTVTIAANGTISPTIISTLTFDSTAGYEPNIIPISGSVYAIAYRGSLSTGVLKTVSIAANGTISPTVISTLTFDSIAGYEPEIILVSGSVYAVAYRRSSNNGYLKTLSIAAAGTISPVAIDTIMFNSTGYKPDIIHIAGDVYAIAYRGANNYGFIKTWAITSQGGSPEADYEIVATSGGSTVRAFVNITSNNVSKQVSIISWQAK
jgi:hypothetical protein